MKPAAFLGMALALWPLNGHARQVGDQRPGLIRPGGLPVFFSSEGPLAYSSLTRSEIPKDAVPLGEVKGRSCQYSLAVPLAIALRTSSLSGAAGNGGYARVLQKIERTHPGLRGIYDVKVDLHQITILGVLGRLCTEMTAEGYR